MISLNDLTREPTQDETSQTIFNLLGGMGFPITAWQPGNAGRTLVELISKLLGSVPLSIRQIAEMSILSRSTGAWLTLYAAQFYQVERQSSVFAVGTLKLANNTGSTKTYVAGQLLAKSSTGKLFRNVAAFSVDNGATASVDWVAEQPGYSYNVGTGSITELSTPIPGISITSPAIGTTGTWLTTYGAEEESDERLRLRCSGKWGELALGSPDAAYTKWCLDASSQVTAVTVSTPGYAGIVRIRLGGPAGGVPSSAVDAVIDLLEGTSDGKLRRALCATLDVASAVTLAIPVSGTVKVTKARKAAIPAEVETRLLAYFAGISIGGEVRRAQIFEEIMTPVGVLDLNLLIPLSNVGLAADQKAKLQLNLTYTT